MQNVSVSTPLSDMCWKRSCAFWFPSQYALRRKLSVFLGIKRSSVAYVHISRSDAFLIADMLVVEEEHLAGHASAANSASSVHVYTAGTHGGKASLVFGIMQHLWGVRWGGAVFPNREGIPARPLRRVCAPDPFQQLGLVPYTETVHDRFTVEIRWGICITCSESPDCDLLLRGCEGMTGKTEHVNGLMSKESTECARGNACLLRLSMTWI